MKARLSATLVLLLLFSSGLAAAPLIGTWVPDMAASLEYARSQGSVPPDQEALLRRSYGGLEVEFTPAEMITHFQGNTSSSTYQVMDNDAGQPAVFLGGRGRVAVEWFIIKDKVLYHALDHDVFPRVYFRRK